MSLLEAFEKLLASLIILAILVLIMFLAFDNDRLVSTPGGERFDPRVEERPDAVPAPRRTALQETAPPATPAPTPAPAPTPQAQNGQQQPAPVNGKAPVPNPGTPPPSSPPAAAAPRQDRAKAPEQAPAETPEPKEPAKKYRNALIKETEPAQQSVAETKSARHEPDLKQTSAERTLPPATTRARRNEGVVHRTEYKKHTRTAHESRRDRNYYYECTDGQCVCDCDHPYWSQSDACADY